MGLAIFTLIHIPHQPRGHHLGTRRPRRLAGRETLSRVDGFFSGDHGGDKCHRVLFPVSRFHTGLWGGRDFHFYSGGGDLRPLCAPALRCLGQGVKSQIICEYRLLRAN